MEKFFKAIILYGTCLFFLHYNSVAQQTSINKKARPNRILGFDFQYAAQLPFADLANKFGFNNAVGGGVRYKTQENYIYGISGNFIFGNTLKNDAINFNGIVSNDGFFVNDNGQLVQARLYERGMSYIVTAGKIFSPKFTNKNSGLMLQVGVGYIQHKIRIELPGENVPQLRSAYKPGYDKLHSGIALQQYIGWHFMQYQQHYANFNVGIEVIEGITQNRRGYNYDMQAYDTKKKLDIFAGIKFTWFIPRYLAYLDGKDEYYFK